MKRIKKETKKKDGMSFREQLDHTWYAIKFIYKMNKWMFYVRIPMLIMQTISTIIPVLFIRLIVNEITIGKNLMNVLIYAGIMAFSSFLSIIISKLLGMFDAKQREKTSHTIKKQLARTFMGMPYSATEDPEIKNRLWAIQYDQFESVLFYLTGFVGAVINVIGLSAIILSMKPTVFFVILISSFVRMIIDNKKRTIPWKFREKKAPVERKTSYQASTMHDAVFGKEVRANNLEKWLRNKFENTWNSEFFPIFKAFTRKMDQYEGYISVLSFVQEGLVYLILAYEVIFNTMTIGDFSMYLSGASQFYDSIMGIAGCYYNFMGHSWGTLRYRECINLAEKLRVEGGDKSIGKVKDVKIEFKNVSFRYPNTERMILNNINIIIEPGETLSIVGINGAGKTTFVKLLCRFYEPTEGEILINGIPAREIVLEEYYDLLSVVFQDFKLFPFSVHENISMDIQYEKERLLSCIEKIGLSERIERLPQNIDTMLFKEFDPEGIELSGGEGQKLAISRALYKDTPIVIFDEPTSALDPIAEYDIYKNFDRLAEKRSAIYISHRLSSTRFTDKIAVFSEGRLAEYGSHLELMKKESGLYREMFEMQIQFYN